MSPICLCLMRFSPNPNIIQFPGCEGRKQGKPAAGRACAAASSSASSAQQPEEPILELPVLRSVIEEATVVLMDNSASMSDVFAGQIRQSSGEETCHGATSSLFVAFKHDSSICKAEDTSTAISRLFPAEARPSNIRMHSHKETNAFKGSCHSIIFHSSTVLLHIVV